MSSMLPLMRTSSELPLRDPVNLKSGYAREAVKTALALRYSLLAHFYSLFHEASSKGVPLARPMFFDFPSDNKTWTEDEQFMVGSALLVHPAFYKNAVSVPVYLPNENRTWYHFSGGHKVNNGTGGITVSVTSLAKELVLLLRGGFIVPTQVLTAVHFTELIQCLLHTDQYALWQGTSRPILFRLYRLKLNTELMLFNDAATTADVILCSIA